MSTQDVNVLPARKIRPGHFYQGREVFCTLYRPSDNTMRIVVVGQNGKFTFNADALIKVGTQPTGENTMNAHDKFLQGSNAAVTGPGTLLALLPSSLIDPMRREVNRGLMVAFINADLLNRAGLDIRTSIVLYDDAGVFEYAMPELPDADTQARLIERTNVRYWSKGI